MKGMDITNVSILRRYSNLKFLNSIKDILYKYTHEQDYHNKSKIMIRELMDIVIHEFDLYDYVKGVNYGAYNPDKTSVLASYDFSEKYIIVFFDHIDAALKDYYKKNTSLTHNEEEKVIESYLRVIRIILHELEHSHQCKMIFEDNSIEQDLVSLGLGVANNRLADHLLNKGMKTTELVNYFCRVDDDFHNTYAKHYLYNPAERLAELKATYVAWRVSMLYDNIPNVTSCFEDNTVTLLSYGYGSWILNSAPSEKFLKNLWGKNIIGDYDLVKRPNASLEDRIAMGLKLTRKEQREYFR